MIAALGGLASSFLGGGGAAGDMTGKAHAGPSSVTESGTRVTDNKSINVINPGASLEGVATLLRSFNSGPEMLGGRPTAITADGRVVSAAAVAAGGGLGTTTIVVAGVALVALFLVLRRR